MWEGHVLLLLERETLELSLKPLSNGQPETFRAPFEDSAHYTDRKSLAEKLSNFVFSTKHSLLLQPGSRNQVTFDAFSISRDGIVTIFQMTVGENHSIKASGLDFIWDAIRDAEMMADSKGRLETLKSFLPRKDNKWRLVFCVPR